MKTSTLKKIYNVLTVAAVIITVLSAVTSFRLGTPMNFTPLTMMCSMIVIGYSSLSKREAEN